MCRYECICFLLLHTLWLAVYSPLPTNARPARALNVAEYINFLVHNQSTQQLSNHVLQWLSPYSRTRCRIASCIIHRHPPLYEHPIPTRGAVKSRTPFSFPYGLVRNLTSVRRAVCVHCAFPIPVSGKRSSSDVKNFFFFILSTILTRLSPAPSLPFITQIRDHIAGASPTSPLLRRIVH